MKTTIVRNQRGEVFKQISKNVAQKAYEAGQTVYMLPANCTFDGVWVSAASISRSQTADKEFDAIVNEYVYYNCNNSLLGYYPHYYVKC